MCYSFSTSLTIFMILSSGNTFLRMGVCDINFCEYLELYVSLLFMMSPMRGHAAREFTTTNTPSIIMGSGEVHIALP